MLDLIKQYLPFLHKKQSHYHRLAKKLTERHSEIKTTVLTKHKDALDWAQHTFSTQRLAAGSLGGLMLLTAPSALALPKPPLLLASQQQFEPLNTGALFISDMTTKLPQEMRPLTPNEEDGIAQLLSQTYGVTAKPELDGKRLNRSYGFIGAEQHLARFPGDSIGTHFASGGEAVEYADSGMAPGLGAYRYFANSREAMTQKENDREKYYIAVQTFLAPGFREHTKEMYEFFRFRKMLVVNPQNGKAMIVVIGDAGPAEWTGKHLGGAPEVMHYLERVDGKQRGPVLYFFLDDPNDTIPLGPIQPVETT